MSFTSRAFRVLRRAPLLPKTLPDSAVEQLFALRRRAAGLRQREVTIGGFPVPYLDGGAGPPVVMLHGFGDNRDSFVDAAAPLVARHRVVMPDLHGFGDTVTSDDADFHIEAQVDHLDDFWRSVIGEPAHFIGNSLGGAVATAFALRRPDAVRSLSLVCAAGVVMPTPSPLQRQLDAGENPFVIDSIRQYRGLLRFILERPPPMPDAVIHYLGNKLIRRAGLNARIMTDLLRDEPDLTPHLPDVRRPTLVLWGTEDRIIDISAGRVFHREIAGSQMVVLHGIGHCPQIEAPGRTGRLLSEFVAHADAL